MSNFCDSPRFAPTPDTRLIGVHSAIRQQVHPRSAIDACLRTAASIGIVWSCLGAFGQEMPSVEIAARDLTSLAAPDSAQTANHATRLHYGDVEVGVAIALPPVDHSEDEQLVERGRGGPMQVGFARQMPDGQRDLAGDAKWTTLSDGTRVASFTVSSPGAGRLRLALQAELPEGAKVRFFDFSGGEKRYPVLTPENFARRGASLISANGGGLLWSPIVDGDRLGVEVEIPAGSSVSGVRLTGMRVSHIPPVGLAQSGQPSVAVDEDDESCPLVDVACEDPSDCARNAAVKITFTLESGATYSCSGTTMNSSRDDEEQFARPYVLTAYRCIATEDAADSVETDWYYQYENCDGSTVVPERTTLHGGAELVVHDSVTDMSLLELREGAPTGGACLLGWIAGQGSVPSTDVISIHHPEGSAKKYLEGSLLLANVESHISAWAVRWSQGSVAGGAAGGGLLMQNEDGYWQLLGTSIGPTELGACPTGFAYGRFDVFFHNVGHSFLDPALHTPDDHGGNFETATGMMIGSTVTASIDHGADADLFRLVVTEPGILILTSTGGVDIYAHLLTEDGTLMAGDDDGGYFSNARISVAVDAGTYYLRVSGFAPSATGTYHLHTAFTPDSEVPAAEIPLFLAADHPIGQGFIRIANGSRDDGNVEITAYDDDGNRRGPVSLAIPALETRHFNSDDLENGNPDKGLQGSTGAGEGDWRLRFNTDLAIEVGAYVRTSDGFLTAIHDVAHIYESFGQHFLSIFNPGSNTNQLSKLRLVNLDTSRSVEVMIGGQDDAGTFSQLVYVTLPAGGSRTLDSTELEQGGETLIGRIGDGTGKWKLWIEAEGDIRVVNLLESKSGHLTNLSSPGHIVE